MKKIRNYYTIDSNSQIDWSNKQVVSLYDDFSFLFDLIKTKEIPQLHDFRNKDIFIKSIIKNILRLKIDFNKLTSRRRMDLILFYLNEEYSEFSFLESEVRRAILNKFYGEKTDSPNYEVKNEDAPNDTFLSNSKHFESKKKSMEYIFTEDFLYLYKVLEPFQRFTAMLLIEYSQKGKLNLKECYKLHTGEEIKKEDLVLLSRCLYNLLKRINKYLEYLEDNSGNNEYFLNGQNIFTPKTAPYFMLEYFANNWFDDKNFVLRPHNIDLIEKYIKALPAQWPEVSTLSQEDQIISVLVLSQKERLKLISKYIES